MRDRKVHRFAHVQARLGSRHVKTSKRSETYTDCGQWLGSLARYIAVSDVAFTHLPIEAQCRNCRLNEPRAFRDKFSRITEATDEERTIVELACHAWGEFCAAVNATGTHADRGCYFAIDSDTCWCGVMTLTNPALAMQWVEHDGDKLLRGIGWWAEHEWRSQDGDEYITARVSHGVEAVL